MSSIEKDSNLYSLELNKKISILNYIYFSIYLILQFFSIPSTLFSYTLHICLLRPISF